VRLAVRQPAGDEPGVGVAAALGCRVGEGAQHPRDITQRVVRRDALGDRGARLALEVQQLPTVGRSHHLQQEQVAVHPLDPEVVPEAGRGVPALVQPPRPLGQLIDDREALVQPPVQPGDQVGNLVAVPRVAGQHLAEVPMHLCRGAPPLACLVGEALSRRQPGQDQVPALVGGGEQLLDHRGVAGHRVPARRVAPAGIDPAEAAADVRAPGHPEGCVDLDVRVHARVQPPEGLTIATAPKSSELLLCSAPGGLTGSCA
jgi:hypothetical protein